MILPRTRLFVIDNAGISIVRCIRIIGYSRVRYGRVGDLGIFSIVRRTPRAQLLKARTYFGVISGVTKKTRFFNGLHTSFFRNSVFLVKWEGRADLALLGRRLKGPVHVTCSRMSGLRNVLGSRVRAFF